MKFGERGIKGKPILIRRFFSPLHVVHVMFSMYVYKYVYKFVNIQTNHITKPLF